MIHNTQTTEKVPNIASYRQKKRYLGVNRRGMQIKMCHVRCIQIMMCHTNKDRCGVNNDEYGERLLNNRGSRFVSECVFVDPPALVKAFFLSNSLEKSLRLCRTPLIKGVLRLF